MWGEAHGAILWWLGTSSSASASASATPAAPRDGIPLAFQILDRMCQEEREEREEEEEQAKGSNRSLPDRPGDVSAGRGRVPPFFRTDLLNLVVNQWRKAMPSMERQAPPEDAGGQAPPVDRSMHPRAVLERLYRYQETSPRLQPDRQTYSMVIDGIASLVSLSAPASGGRAAAGSSSANTFVDVAWTENEDVVAMVNEIVDWLVHQSTKQGDDHGASPDIGDVLDGPSTTPSSSPPPQRAATLSPNVWIFSSAMNAWAKSGREDAPIRVERLLNQMKALRGVYPAWDVAPNNVTYTTAIDTWAKVGRVDKVRGLLREMHHEYSSTGDPSLRPGLPAFNGFLVALSKSGSTNEAEALLKQMEDLYESGELEECPNVISYSTVLDGFSRSHEGGASIRAETFLRKMIERHGIAAPNAVTYNSVIHAHVQCGDIQAAERLLGEMHETYLRGENSEVRPTLRTYSTVLSGLAKSGRPDAGERAEQILDLVKEMAKSGELEEPPDVVLYNTVLDCWAKSSASEMSIRSKLFLEKMIHDSIPPDVISYNTVIHCMTRSGNPQEAESLLEEMKAAGVHPNNITYNTLLAAHFTKSSSTTRHTSKGSKATSGTSRFVHADRAELLFERMKNDPHVKPDVVTYNTMLHFYSQNGNVGKAESFLAEMLNDDSPVRPDSTSMNTVIKAWANSGRTDAPQRAEDILNEMLAESGEDRRVSNVHHTAITFNRLPNPTSITFNSVMSAWTKSRKSEAAERCQRLFLLMNDLVKKGQIFVKPDFVTFNTLIHAWSLADDEDAPDHGEALFLDMKRQYEAGNSRMHPNTRTYGSLISVWSKSKRPNSGEKAEEYLRKIIETSRPVKQSSQKPRRRHFKEDPRVFEFTSAIRAWANSGDPRAPYKADEILNLLLQQLHQGNELARPDSSLIGAILTTLAVSKVPNKAIYTERIIEMMKAYNIPPNRVLLQQIKKCFEDGSKTGL